MTPLHLLTPHFRDLRVAARNSLARTAHSAANSPPLSAGQSVSALFRQLLSSDDATPTSRVSHLGIVRTTVLTAGAAVLSLADPSRADMVALVGELTAPAALVRMKADMESTQEGREILAERPRIKEGTIDLDGFLAGDTGSFGHAYAHYLRAHGFSPDERHEVTCVGEEDLRYVLQRYREVHDLWHVLAGLPPSVLGEAAVKWLEMVQTGLPMTALASFASPLRMTAEERRLYWSVYVPWASRVGRAAVPLMSVRYERLLALPLEQVRQRLRFAPAPVPSPELALR